MLLGHHGTGYPPSRKPSLGLIVPLLENTSPNFYHVLRILDSALDSNSKKTRIGLKKHLSTKKFQCLLRAGMNFQDRVGWSLLHPASSLGHCDIGLLLLENSADTNVKKKNSWTALHIASHWGRCEIIQR
jgi:ankyrin repeat protein